MLITNRVWPIDVSMLSGFVSALLITYAVEADTAVQLADIDSRTAISISECLDICSDNPNCMVFTATANTDVLGTFDCFFFDEDSRAQDQVGSTRYVKTENIVMRE